MKDFHINKKPVLQILKRYHFVIFSVSTVLLLSVVVLLLSGIVSTASGTDTPAPNSTAWTFDQATIDRIKQLKTSDQPGEPLDLSGGRIDPFSE